MNFQKIKYIMGAAMPYMLTFASLNMILIVGINGVPGNFMGSIFKVDLMNLQIPPANFTSLTGMHVSGTENITATSIGLADKYSFYLWNYASITNGAEIFHDENIDYIRKLNVSEITINGNTSSLPGIFMDIENGFRNKIRFSEYIFLAALINAFFVLIFGILACFGKKFKLRVVSFFTAITTALMVAFATLITATGSGTKGDLHKFEDFGLKSEVGTSDLGIVWLAIVHMVVICIMFGLMGVGVMKMNPSVQTAQRLRSYDEELLQHESNGRDFSMASVTPK